MTLSRLRLHWRPSRTAVAHALELAGLCVFLFGCSYLSIPAALIAGGLLLVFLAQGVKP